MPWAPCLFPSSSFSRRTCKVSCSFEVNLTRPGPTSGFGISGEPGRKKKSTMETDIVKSPSTTVAPLVTRHHLLKQMHLLRNNHCQPFIPLAPLNFRIPEARSGLMALPPNMPKKRMATRLANSFLTYHVDRVYIAPGMYPASARPRANREMRNPVRFFRNTCIVATTPNKRT